MSTGLTAAIKEVWSKKLLKLINHNAVMEPLVWTDYESDFASGGNTVNVRLPGDITINDYTRESAVTYQDVTWTNYTFTLSQQKYFAFAVDDLDAAQMDVDVIEPELNQAAIKIRNTVDTNLLGQYANLSSSTALGSTSLPVNLTKDNVFSYFDTMFTNLLNQDTPTDKPWAAVVPPAIRSLIVNSPEMTQRSTQVVDENIQNGLSVKNYAGFNIHVTTNMSQVSGVWPLMLFHPFAIAFASQVKKIQTIPVLQTSFESAARGLFLYDSNVFSHYSVFGGTLYAA